MEAAWHRGSIAQKFILMLLRFIDGASKRKVDSSLKMLIEPIYCYLASIKKKLSIVQLKNIG